MIDVMAKLDETIDIIDNDKIVKRLKELKSIIDSDIEIQKLLATFDFYKIKYEQDLIMSDELREAKERFYEHPIMLEYRSLYSKLNLSFARFNKSILKMLDVNRHSCSFN